LMIGYLLALGHEVVAVTTDSSLPIDAAPVRSLGAAFEFIVVPQRKRSFGFEHGVCGRAWDGFLRERRALCLAMQQAKPDIVHAHWAYEFG